MRAIAKRAEVDVALVSYYFGTKGELFVAALELPIDPAVALRAVFAEGADGAGTRMLRKLLQVWDDPVTGAPLAALFRSLPTQSQMLRQYIERRLLTTVTEVIDGPEAELRAAGFVSQVLGLVLERYILGIEPIASASQEEIVELIGPSLQRYLTG